MMSKQDWHCLILTSSLDHIRYLDEYLSNLVILFYRRGYFEDQVWHQCMRLLLIFQHLLIFQVDHDFISTLTAPCLPECNNSSVFI
jgi:hypothetical protein